MSSPITSAPVEIRAYAEKDFEGVTALWHGTNRAAYPYVAEHQRHTLHDAREYFRNHVLPENRVWVAICGAQPAGLVAVSATHITQFAIAADLQRRGIGSAQLRHVLANTRGDLCLHTFRRNEPARHFYEKHGFRDVAFGISPAPENEPDVEYLMQRT